MIASGKRNKKLKLDADSEGLVYHVTQLTILNQPLPYSVVSYNPSRHWAVRRLSAVGHLLE